MISMKAQFTELRQIMLDISRIVDTYRMNFSLDTEITEDLAVVKADLMQFVLSISILLEDINCKTAN